VDGPGSITHVHCDVTSEESFGAAISEAIKAHGKLDILFNNAGAGGTQLPIAEMDMAEWDKTIGLLLRSAALGMKLAVPAMIAGGGGAIVNTASVAAFSAGNAPIAYSVAKAGVLHLSKVAAAELARHSIRVNAICPGLILTGIFTQSYAAEAPQLAADVTEYMRKSAPRAQPLQIPGMPEDIAAALLYLVSDESRFVTGTHLLVDGGMQVGARHSWDPEFRRPDDHPLTKILAG
jgi:NAD(P)-dependent dehydrogenase (short-subunit alcohol dehydrogenase family)